MEVKRSWNWGPRVWIGGIPGRLGGRTKQTEAAVWAFGGKLDDSQVDEKGQTRDKQILARTT